MFLKLGSSIGFQGLQVYSTSKAGCAFQLIAQKTLCCLGLFSSATSRAVYSPFVEGTTSPLHGYLVVFKVIVTVLFVVGSDVIDGDLVEDVFDGLRLLLRVGEAYAPAK